MCRRGGFVSRVVVDAEDLRRLAARLSEVAADLGAVAAQAHGALATPLIVAAAAVDPVGAARVAATVLPALDGPRGLMALAGSLHADVVALRAARARYELADRGPWDELAELARAVAAAAAAPSADVPARVGDLLRAGVRALEATVTWSTPALETVLPLVVLAQTAVTVPLTLLAPLPVQPLLARLHAGRLQFVRESLGRQPTTVDPLLGRPLAETARRWPQGPGDAVPARLDEGSSPAAAYWRRAGDQPIGSLDVAMRRVAALSELGAGRIAVEEVRGADGGLRWVVTLPGIRALPDTPYPQDLPGAVAALALSQSAYSRAVVAALDRAGVPPGAPVLLVGHSQGGIVAMNLAGDPAFNGGRCRVTHVVAAGAPITHKEALPGTRVLTVENTHDVVTHLDNEDSRRRRGTADRVDVAFSHDGGMVSGNHAADLYAAELAALRDSPAPQVRAFLDSAELYLAGPTRTTGWRLTDAAAPVDAAGSGLPVSVGGNKRRSIKEAS
jgi:hypothetical protein